MGHEAMYSVKDEEKTSGDLQPVSSYNVGEQMTMDTAHGMKRSIKSRHAQMIAIGGTIGTGLFVGSGQALARAGPGFLLLAYLLISLLVYGIVTAVMEVASYVPLPGASMAYCAHRYVSPSMSFALGWLYFYSFGIIAAYEITAASIVIDYWPNNVHIAVWITMMLVVIVALNFCPVGIYAETEFWFAGVKVVMIVGLLILSFILFWGGGPQQHGILGFHYWNDPGAVKTYIVSGDGGRLTAFIWVWTYSGFSFFFGPELIVYTAGEMRHPRKNLPIAARQFFYRLMLFYVLGALAIGVICNSNSKRLVSGAGNANASPWVIAISNAGISTLPSIINVGILLSAWSSGNSYLYMSSRALYSLALQGSAPKVLAKCNKAGVPYLAVTVSSCFCLLAYLSTSSAAGEVFNWFINLTNTAGFTSWICCCIIFIRFRKACDIQGVTPTYKSKVQPWAAWVCLVVFSFLMLMNGFTIFFPGRFNASDFLTAYVGIPVFFVLYFGHRLTDMKAPWLKKPSEIDLVSGIREVEDQAAAWDAADKRDEANKKGWIIKTRSILCG